ncbi:MAG: sigma-54-dependent Fis family transcriptional regulator, partial [Chitinophagaceae bacterium]
KNIADQVSVLSTDKMIGAPELKRFLPDRDFNRLPILAANSGGSNGHEFANERDLLYKLFFDMKKDVTELKRMFLEMLQNPEMAVNNKAFMNELKELKAEEMLPHNLQPVLPAKQPVMFHHHNDAIDHHEEVEESLNIMDKEKELILKALKKHKGKRKDAALDLGISERTLYRKLKEYDIRE